MIGKLLDFAALYQAVQDGIGAPAGMRRFVRDYLPIPQNARVLDIGCGTAAFRQYLPGSVEYVGLDVNPRYIEQAKKNVPEGRFYLINEEPECFPEKEFDYCVFIGVLHHMSDAVAQNALRLAAKSLKKAGTMVALEPVLHDKRGHLERLLMRLDRGRFIRTMDQYRVLLRGQFPSENGAILPPLCRIPWTHCLLSGRLEE